MKTFFTAIVLCLLCSASKANLIIDNDISCDVAVVVFAHDANYFSPCSFYSNRMTVPAGGPDGNYPYVAALNPYNNPSGGYITAINTGSGWDAVWVYILDGHTTNGLVGNLSGCAGSTTWTGVSPNCGTIHITWTVSGSNTIVNIHP